MSFAVGEPAGSASAFDGTPPINPALSRPRTHARLAERRAAMLVAWDTSLFPPCFERKAFVVSVMTVFLPDRDACRSPAGSAGCEFGRAIVRAGRQPDAARRVDECMS